MNEVMSISPHREQFQDLVLREMTLEGELKAEERLRAYRSQLDRRFEKTLAMLLKLKGRV